VKDFGSWFNEQKPVDDRKAHIEMLEEAGILYVMADGRYMARCCCCDEWKELPVGPEEIDLGYEHYCGGSPRCCP
jgi:hypothetical protein